MSNEREEELLTSQRECTFIWTTADGFPVGEIMSFIDRAGRI